MSPFWPRRKRKAIAVLPGFCVLSDSLLPLWVPLIWSVQPWRLSPAHLLHGLSLRTWHFSWPRHGWCIGLLQLSVTWSSVWSLFILSLFSAFFFQNVWLLSMLRNGLIPPFVSWHWSVRSADLLLHSSMALSAFLSALPALIRRILRRMWQKRRSSWWSAKDMSRA